MAEGSAWVAEAFGKLRGWKKLTAALALGVVVLAACWVGWKSLVLLVIPSWRVFLGFEGVVSPALALVFGGGLLSGVNVPTFLSRRGRSYWVNLFGAVTPVVLAVYAARTLHPTFRWLYALPWALSVVVYLFASYATPTGVKVRLLALHGVGAGWLAFLRLVAHLPLRELMFWGFVGQFSSLLVMDLYRAVADVDTFNPGIKLSIGGAGARDALWSGPSSVVFYAYVAQWALWGGVEGLAGAR